MGEGSGQVEFTELLDGLSTSNSLDIYSSCGNARYSGLKEADVLVPCVSLDDYVARTSRVPNVIKIDVEGAELAVLTGGANTLREHRPTVLIVFIRFGGGRTAGGCNH